MAVYLLAIVLERLRIERGAGRDQAVALGFAPGFQLFRSHAAFDLGVLSLVHDF